MYGARKSTKRRHQTFFAVVRRLAQQAPYPYAARVYLIPQETANAFATGAIPRTPAVAVTEGIMRLLDS